MALFRNGDNLFTEIKKFVSEANDLTLFVPYVKVGALGDLLDGISSCRALIVRWEPADIIMGASDLEVYGYCQTKGIKLFRNPRLHLKAYVSNFNCCLFGSANISMRALNYPVGNGFNYEVLGYSNLEFEDRLYLSKIIDSSTLVTQEVYDGYKNLVNNYNPVSFDEIEFKNETDGNKCFLISSLPMTNSIKTLWRVYSERSGIHDEEINCAIHDLALYNVPMGLSGADFISYLQKAFFEHAFIKHFLQCVQMKGGEIYFGDAKAWIHANCADVPTPRRWEITENIQILYRWIVDLAEDTFFVDRPNYSQRLAFKKME